MYNIDQILTVLQQILPSYIAMIIVTIGTTNLITEMIIMIIMLRITLT